MVNEVEKPVEEAPKVVAEEEARVNAEVQTTVSNPGKVNASSPGTASVSKANKVPRKDGVRTANDDAKESAKPETPAASGLTLTLEKRVELPNGLVIENF
jgi:hypothetical protein